MIIGHQGVELDQVEMVQLPHGNKEDDDEEDAGIGERVKKHIGAKHGDMKIHIKA